MKNALFFACLGLLAFTGCATETLTVQMDYISHENLASAHVITPDPRLETGLVGQRLIISWWIPLCYKDSTPYEIHLRLRYGNREEAKTIIPVSKRIGWYVYTLANEEYFEKNGIKTYDVELFADGELIDKWQHQLWVELIHFPEAPEEEIELEDDRGVVE